MKFFEKREEKKPEPLKIPNVTFSVPDVRHELWKCNRCSAAVFENDLELHAFFHQTQDRLLEQIMMLAENIEKEKEKEQND